MIYYHYQDTQSPSEEPFYYHCPGSSLSCRTEDFESSFQPFIGETLSPHYTESLDSLDSLDTSDCSQTDYSWPEMLSEMSAPSSSATSMAETWIQSPGQNSNTAAQPNDCPYHSQGVPVTAQGLSALDNATRMSAPLGSVVSGSSPVLSYHSQSSYTHPSASEPEPFALPMSAEFSFTTTGPSWDSFGPAAYTSPTVNATASVLGPSMPYGHSEQPLDYTLSSAQGMYPGLQPLDLFHLDSQAGCQLRRTSGPQAQALPMRPLLPRTGGTPATSSRLTPATAGVSRPYMQGSHRSYSVTSSVSTMSGQPQHGLQRTLSPATPPGPVTMRPMQASTLPHTAPGQVPAGYSVQPDIASYNQPAVQAPVEAYDPAADFAYFMDATAAATSPTTLSYMSVSNATYPSPVNMPGDFQNVSTHPEGQSQAGQLQSGPATEPSSMEKTAPNVSADRDECRYRTDKLYFQLPADDGLHHCPWENDKIMNCNHKPTKLKCNYEYGHSPPPPLIDRLTDLVSHRSKYIDSHLKPFICRIDQCGNQQFSSTACLLRHEREAHGMHGHGDRPYLCIYEGCDRFLSGFPRKYNQLDHMRRVHGHKVETDSVIGSNDLSNETANQRRSGNRKRRTAAHPSAESEAQRSRTATMASAQQPRVIAHAHSRYQGQASVDQAIQSQPMQRTYRSVQGAGQLYQEESAHLHYATQGHAADLRRLSAQRG